MPDTIICPQCKASIEVTEVLSAQLRSELRREFDAEQRKREAELSDREADLARAKQDVAAAKAAVDQLVAEQLQKERQQLTEKARLEAKEQLSVEFQDLQQQLAASNDQLKTARAAELQLRQERRQLEQEKESLELTLARRLDEERGKIREAARKEAVEETQLKAAEKDKLISDLNRQIADLKRKSEQGSQQLQGEVLELTLEDALARTFPYDTITPVPKGIHGGDVIHEVRDASGHVCGLILWESKRTKAWSEGWLPKLRDDQRAAKAQLAILVSAELPKHIANFGCVDGVWVTGWPCAVALAHAICAGLIEVGRAKQAMDGQHGKMELLYQYLSGSEFRHHVEGIIEAFVTLKDDLEAEKRATQRLWAKRDEQLERAISQTAGMYGDLQGIVGRALPAIGQLTMPGLLEGSDPDAPAGTEE